MKKRLLLTTLVLIAALCWSANVWAVAPALYYVHDFKCDNCHIAGSNINSLQTNICLNCHDEASVSGGSLARVRYTDGGPVMTPSRDFTVLMASETMGSRSGAGVSDPADPAPPDSVDPGRNRLGG